MLFNPGHLILTSGALSLLEQGIDLGAYLARHLRGDWGVLCPDDLAANNQALRCGLRLLSAYDTPCGSLWILTEADRTTTTFLIPDEY